MTDLIPNDLSHMSDADFNVLCPQGHHAPGPEPLSPAAQAVLDAFNAASDGHYDGGEWIQDHAGQIAAALRTAVNEAAPEKTIEDIDYVHQSYVDGYKDALYEILNLVDELEAQ